MLTRHGRRARHFAMGARATATAAATTARADARTRARCGSWWRDRDALLARTSRTTTREGDGVEDELRAARRARGDARALGVDYGARRIGLAVSDSGMAPRPLRTMEHRGSATTGASAREVAETAARECCDRIVVGVPKQPGRGMKDRRGRGRGAVRMDLICARFAGEVADALARSEDANARAVTVYTLDESRTSVEAAERMEASGSTNSVDAASAAILLERYFDGSYGEPKVVKPLA